MNNGFRTRITSILYCLHLVLSSFCSAEFEISVPSAPLVAIHGHDAVLSCTFPVGKVFDPSSSVITWQRGIEVVHSFFYSQDQLDQQSRRYANRTSLYHSELERGNASLRLKHVTPDDAGAYTCLISTLIGSQKKTFQVKIAAFYTEPHLQVSSSPEGVELMLTSRGYPTPKVQWLSKSGGALSNETATRFQKDTEGLYVVTSSLTQERGANSTLTFVLQNDDLQQEIRREFSLYAEAVSVSDEEQSSRLYLSLAWKCSMRRELGSRAGPRSAHLSTELSQVIGPHSAHLSTELSQVF
ncbi:hypothetical protein AGOR_G00102060 [Albula goreensis]|uniref:Ig-like domain-containing protein n=1 Tax=Albula goreensis TaxID=1534307 RepID=A0A8T3DC30_9TELE|nr:hypothetical protein AGOR_G00102060 [Albula goreensis]